MTRKFNISVIIPVYNVKKYLRRCLDSLVNQTISDIEIICINDGSTDSSLEILKEYAKKDERIKIINQENQKQGAARNRGLEVAQGEFITFVDSDDWVDADYLEELYNAIINSNVNIAVASMIRNKGNRSKNHLRLNTEKTYYGASNIVKAIDNHLETAGKLYRFDCISDLRFEEETLYEDGGYTIRALNKCNSIVTVPDAVYH